MLLQHELRKLQLDLPNWRVCKQLQRADVEQLEALRAVDDELKVDDGESPVEDGDEDQASVSTSPQQEPRAVVHAAREPEAEPEPQSEPKFESEPKPAPKPEPDPERKSLPVPAPVPLQKPVLQPQQRTSRRLLPLERPPPPPLQTKRRPSPSAEQRITPIPQPQREPEPANESLECTSCTDVFQSSDIIRAPCGDRYCKACIEYLFTQCMTDESLFLPRCCQIEIPYLLVRRYLSQRCRSKFGQKRNELQTKNRTYCWVPTCSAFIKADSIDRNNAASCPKGNHTTCALCKNAWHPGTCPGDTTREMVSQFSRQTVCTCFGRVSDI